MMKVNRATVEQTIRTLNAAGWTDREIASNLGISVSTATVWRVHFGIPCAEKFPRTFCRKYGDDALARFRLLVAEGTTLEELGQTFGFTREYARQVYNKLYGHGKGRGNAAWRALDTAPQEVA